MKKIFWPLFLSAMVLFACKNTANEQVTDYNFDDTSNLEPADTFNYCCSALGFEFHRNKYRMASFLGNNWQPYGTTEFLGKTTRQIVENDTCKGCTFVNTDTNANFSLLKLQDDTLGFIYFAKLSFSENSAQLSAKEILQKLVNENGAPKDSVVWYEEKFKHFSYKWEKQCCIMYYDFGGIENTVGTTEKMQPVWLIFESKPAHKNFTGEVLSQFKRK